ncbi:DNA gyrase inhibitor [Labrys sp. WJW]|uniref:DNA gyrase inhibitor YacG n=1 Tax=Labrys sp. WJW TaxID=1737983 RepID=UPI000834F3D4|nr:DNA gyrase inhibitor YacG [Labrys sp. WJW]OCC04741.1 DNA gyrase inhibitor [Labrys sp. WJW]
MSDPVPTPLVKRKCPICGKPSVEASKPFCSKRCADIDLSRWLKGVYAIPGEEADQIDPDNRDDYPKTERDR